MLIFDASPKMVVAAAVAPDQAVAITTHDGTQHVQCEDKIAEQQFMHFHDFT